MTLLVGMDRCGQRILAADTMCTSSNGWGQKFRGINKIIPLLDGAIAFTGDFSPTFRLNEYLKNNETKAADILEVLKKSLKKSDSWEAMLVSNEGIESVFKNKTKFKYFSDFATLGSGCYVGLGAIEALYDSELTNTELLDKVFAITAKNINTVGKFYTFSYTSQPT